MKTQFLKLLAFRCTNCFQRLRALSDRYFTAKLMHAWILGFIALGYVAWAAPLALQSLVLVAAKVWIGALIGHFLGKALFNDGEIGYRKTAVVCAAVLAMALGV